MGNVRILSASAGSGKTYRLAYEYVKSVVEEPQLYRRILAVTFTNKATEEMSGRILARLHELAAGEPSPYLKDLLGELPFDERKIRARALEAQRLILHDYSRFAVLTIDRFFQRLIRSFIREMGIEVNFNLELETDPLLSLAADALIEESTSDSGIRSRLFAAARERIEENRRWNVKEPLLGLGKELFGEEYLRAREGLPPDAATENASLIEALAEKAAAAQARMTETAKRAMAAIDSAGLAADDFKGRSRSLVPWLARVAAGEFIPLSAPAREASASDDISAWAVKTSPNRAPIEGLIPTLRPLLAAIDAIYTDNFRLVGSVRLLRENYRNFLLLSDLQRHIERICAQENIMPISETNRIIGKLVAGNDTPFVFEKAGSYYSRFFIDEFQDTSASQWENFVPLLKNAIASEQGSPVMLIGDIKQAIYRWRGGDWQILSKRVREEMGPDRVEVEELDVNYRSMRRVVEFNNAATGLVAAAGNSSLNTILAEGVAQGALDASEAAPLTDMLAGAYRGHVQTPKNDSDEGYVTLTVYGADADGEYTPPLVEKIEELQSRGYRAGDIAVLVRSNDQGARVARMLLARKHENPDSPYRYDVVTAEALTVGASAVSRFIVACLALAVDRDDSIRRAVYNGWLGLDFGAPLDGETSRFFARLATLSTEEAFEETVLRFALYDRPEDIAYIQAVHQQITTFSSRSVADIPLFLKWWEERGATASITMQGSSEGAGGDAVTVSTIHKSKGLQYRALIVPYLSWTLSPGRGIVWAATSREGLDAVGAMPINYKEAMSASFFSPKYYREQVLAHIDAMNMFYVAVTRAEQELHLMTPSNPRLARNAVGNLLRSVLQYDEQGAVRMGDVHGTRSVTDSGDEVMAFGRPVRPARGDAAPDKALRHYPTSRPAAKVRLRLPSSRYFDEGGAALSPRDFGVLMHRAFERADGAGDVYRTLEAMRSGGVVSPDEYTRLKEVVGKAFSNPLVAGWFVDGWTQVHNEGDIVRPGEGGTRRPDRVMTRENMAVVVDYKFGRRQSPDHAAQLAGYISLLREMGYAEVEGYIWYVSLDEIVKVP